jgi:hypothetical protein
MDLDGVWSGIGGGVLVAGAVALAKLLFEHVDRRGQRALDREDRRRAHEWDAEARLERLLEDQLADAERRVERYQADAQTERGRRAELERAYLELERAHAQLGQQCTALAEQLVSDTARMNDPAVAGRNDPAVAGRVVVTEKRAGRRTARSGRVAISGEGAWRPTARAQGRLQRRVLIVGRRGVVERYVSLQRRYARLQAEHLVLLEQVERTEMAGSFGTARRSDEVAS